MDYGNLILGLVPSYIRFSSENSAVLTGRSMILSQLLQGNASGGERARIAGQKANSLIGTAWSFIARESVLPQHPPSGSSIFS